MTSVPQSSRSEKVYKIFSWNVNGIRAVIRKNALQEFIRDYSPDILCLQETKAKREQSPIDFDDYEEIWNSAKRLGYSGTAIFTKPQPETTFAGFPDELAQAYDWDEDHYGTPLNEGRVLTAEYPEFFLVTVYTPNSKPDLSRLGLRDLLWDPAFLSYLKSLERTKPVVVCGDFNAAHTEIDLARPKTNHHSAGFTDEERKGFANYLEAGFIDTFRLLHPDVQRYTWWSHWGNARANNVGWRIDYFLISKSLEKRLVSADIHESVLGSDHCPISIELRFGLD